MSGAVPKEALAEAVNQEMVREIGTLRARTLSQRATARHQFICAALTGCLAFDDTYEHEPLARKCVSIADAILAELDKDPVR